MKTQTKKQVELLKKYGIDNYTIEGDKITINGSLYLHSLTSADKDFLKGTTINGYLDLNSLTSADKDFLKGTTINGYLDLNSLTSADKDLLCKNVKQLQKGYNEQGGYCYFDGILTKVLAYSKKKGYGVYTTPIGYIAQKGEYTAHGQTLKQAIVDLEFKIVSEKLKNEPIKEDTLFTVKYYRLLTGACDSGCRQFMQQNNIEYDVVGNETVERKAITAKELLPILEKSKPYGYDKFKQLITF